MTATTFEELPPKGSSNPMAGWEAFGAIVAGGTPPHTPAIRPLGGNENWPASELAGGVAGITIGLYADDTTGGYVQVVGPDRTAVEATFTRAAELVRSGATAALFPGGAS